MAIDPNTIDAAEDVDQLRHTAGRSFNAFAKASIRAMKKKNFDRGDFLIAVFTAIRFGESAYQKSKAKFVRMAAEISRDIAKQIQKNPEKLRDVEKIRKMGELLLRLDEEQAIERRKADMMTRWIRGTYSEVTKVERSIANDIGRYNLSRERMMLKMKQKNANDNQKRMQQPANDNLKYRKTG
jgi:hypothetical protein